MAWLLKSDNILSALTHDSDLILLVIGSNALTTALDNPFVIFISSSPPSLSPRSHHVHLEKQDSALALLDALQRAESIARSHNRLSLSQRPFDAIFNFLPPRLSDKSILKQTILTTTICHPFLATPIHRPRAASTPHPNRWTSFFSRSNRPASAPTPPQPPPKSDKAHLIHVLPPHYDTAPTSALIQLTQSKLIDSVDSFLSNFAYPEYVTSSSSDRAALYFLSAATLSSKVQHAPSENTENTENNTISVSDILLFGLLDPPPPSSNLKQKQKANIRTWIESADDIVVLGADGWSSGRNSASLARRSLIARPGLGLSPSTQRFPRNRHSQLSIVSTTSTPPRSVSSPNVARPMSVQLSPSPTGASSIAAHRRQPSLPDSRSMPSFARAQTLGPKAGARFLQPKKTFTVGSGRSSITTVTPPSTPPGTGVSPGRFPVKTVVVPPTPEEDKDVVFPLASPVKTGSAGVGAGGLVTPPDTDSSDEGAGTATTTVTTATTATATTLRIPERALRKGRGWAWWRSDSNDGERTDVTRRSRWASRFATSPDSGTGPSSVKINRRWSLWRRMDG